MKSTWLCALFLCVQICMAQPSQTLDAIKALLPGWKLLTPISEDGYHYSLIDEKENEAQWSKMFSYGFIPYQTFSGKISPQNFTKLFFKQIEK